MRAWWLIVGAGALLGVSSGLVRRSPPDEALARALPEATTAGGYTTSNACQACHPDQYDSWHRSYHRTMTQVASPSTVVAPFDGAVLESRGFQWRFERRGQALWVEMPDPIWFEEPVWLMQLLDETWPERPPTVRARVVLSTGSHHMQTYWVRRQGTGGTLPPDDGSLIQVPWVWLIDEGRWVPNQDSFLTPPSGSVGGVARWNANCSQCHSVGTAPGASASGRFATRTAELGIACEACHGPAEKHVTHYRSPMRRYLRYLRLARGDDPADATIVNPAKLGPRRSSEVCGQCHSFGVWRDEAAYLARGIAFVPGDSLEMHRRVFRYDDDPSDPILSRMLADDSLALESTFWSDGTSRVAGREYNAAVASTHYGSTDFTCLSCHSLHEYETRDAQLLSGPDSDASCVRCHEEYVEASRVAVHTRHPAGSSGAACMNCHMPRTTYGLFEAMRSHRIDSPDSERFGESDRPNACNLCHLDRTLAWASGYLEDWYGQEPAALEDSGRSVAAGPLWTLAGDAVVRTIVAWHMGWPPARQASGEEWMPPYLAQLLTDPYAATRRVAHRSLVALPAFADFRYDYIGSAAVRGGLADEVTARWLRNGGAPHADGGLLMTVDGRPASERWLTLLAVRDQTPVMIRE